MYKFFLTNIKKKKNGRYFAICSHPKQDTIGLLVDSTKESNKRIVDSLYLYTSPAMGRGFPKEKIIHKNIICVMHGSGISAIYPFLLEFQSNPREYSSLHIFYGVRNRAHIPFRKIFSQLKKENNFDSVFITICYSRTSNFLYANKGYIQNILSKKLPDNLFQNNKIALLVGSNGMIKDTKNVLYKKKFIEKEILLNY